MDIKSLSRQELDHFNSHGTSLSRREFVGLGLLGATSTLFLPSPLKVFSSVFAAEMSTKRRLAYLGFDLVGGAGLSGNFLVGKQGGAEDLLSSYSRLGWDPRVDGYDSRFGLPMAKANVSKIFQGMTETMSAKAQANFRMASFCHVSRDDSGDNPLSVIQMISKIQSLDAERSIKKPIGTGANTTGGNSRSVKEIAEFSAVKISNLDDVIGLSQIPSPLNSYSARNFKEILKRVAGLSRLQADKLLNDERARETINKSFGELPNLASAGKGFDPRTMEDVKKVYGLDANTEITNRNAVRSGIVSATLNHQVGGSVISIEGCDYHDGTFITGDNKDLEIGREIGRAVELAHQRKEALFIHLFSDGSVFSREGARNWAGDDGEKSMSVIGLYDPDKIPAYRSDKHIQIGSYTDGQGVNRDTLIGATPALGAYAVLVNYLNAAGLASEIDTYLPRIFSAAELEQVLVFNA